MHEPPQRSFQASDTAGIDPAATSICARLRLDNPRMRSFVAGIPADVTMAKLRWRIERDYQDLKQEVGLGHYEGRSWRRFHHHASLSIAAYGFLVSERSPIPPQDPAGTRRSHPGRRPGARAAFPIRPERHASGSIATRRRLINACLAVLPPRCPCCLRPRQTEPSPGHRRL